MGVSRWLAAAGFVLAVGCGSAMAWTADLPATVYDDPALLVKNKNALANGTGPKEAIAALKKDADGFLNLRPSSVMNKSKAGPSGDKHDYVSYAPYFWPDPKDPKAAYVRHDGHRNSDQVSQGDAPAYEKMLGAVHTLGLAYFYTGDERYAAQASKLARTWFLDPDTAMNPNFKFAQAIPNSVSGRGTGLIEDRGLVGALDGLTLIHGSKSWSPADEKAIREWVEKFDEWMTTSDEGLAEKKAPNNHGSWYAVQETGLYLYLNKPDKAQEVLLAIKDRIAKQIEPDGKQPLELAREDGFSYSVFNIHALVTLAELAQRQKIDLWFYEKDGRGIKQAIDYLMPYANGSQKWPNKQLKRITPDSLIPVVYSAWQVYTRDSSYRAWLQSEKDAVMNSDVLLSGDE